MKHARLGFALIVAGLIFIPGAQSQAPHNETKAIDPCLGRPALYQPDNIEYTPERGLKFIDALRNVPIAFASSGDKCLGPIPVYKARVSHWETTERDTHAMARTLAPVLAQYSRDTGEEACARMCKTSQGEIVARIVTIRAHVACLAPASTCPEGSVATKETIHSHPPHTAFVANPIDALGWDDPSINGLAQFAGYPNSLSPPDRAMAPVWLVGTNAQLIYLDNPDGVEVERP